MEKPEGRRLLVRRTRRRIILKLVLYTFTWMAWTGFMLLRVGAGFGVF